MTLDEFEMSIPLRGWGYEHVIYRTIHLVPRNHIFRIIFKCLGTDSEPWRVFYLSTTDSEMFYWPVVMIFPICISIFAKLSHFVISHDDK